MLKVVSTNYHPFEADIQQYFSSPLRSSDHRNHCAFIYDVLQLPNDANKVLLVMPLLRRYDDPPFDAIAEVVEYFNQVFEVDTRVNPWVC
jgi:hypothetical protein